MTLPLREVADGVILAIRAQPGAKRSRVVGVHGDSLKIAIAAPPVDGKANAALTDFIAEVFALRRVQVELIKGATGPAKAFLLRDITLDAVRRRVDELTAAE